MTKCPGCETELERLQFVTTDIVLWDVRWNEERKWLDFVYRESIPDEVAETFFECPYCQEFITDIEEEASKFLQGLPYTSSREGAGKHA